MNDYLIYIGSISISPASYLHQFEENRHQTPYLLIVKRSFELPFYILLTKRPIQELSLGAKSGRMKTVSKS